MPRTRSARLLSSMLVAVTALPVVAGPTLAWTPPARTGPIDTPMAVSTSSEATGALAGEPADVTAFDDRLGFRSGVDVSHWNGRIGWRAVAASGIDFVIAKATQGTWFVDPRYVRNKWRSQRHGLKFTAYHYAEPGRRRGDGVREADHFLRTARLKGHHLIPALDLEESRGLTPKQLRRWLWEWLGRVHDRLGVKPMIYTSPSFWRNRVGNVTTFADRGYRVLWISHWDTDRPNVPARRWNGEGWTFWQYTDCGRIPGFRSCVDRNRYNGTDLWRLRIRHAAR